MPIVHEPQDPCPNGLNGLERVRGHVRVTLAAVRIGCRSRSVAVMVIVKNEKVMRVDLEKSFEK